ncbi:MAG: hypothetical protein ACRD19_13605 [Terriglobia bacterium]
MSRYIAERHLLFSEKNGGVRKKLRVMVCAPRVVAQDEVDFPVDGVVSICHVDMQGLDEHSFDVYGTDSMQAVNLASNIESLIKRLSDKYDFFWATGEPYFEDE